MARVLFKDEWYDPISSGALYEAEFESQILAYSHRVYSDYIPLRFKQTVSSDYSSARADFAFIHKDYREWWVVEVEMGRHSLSGHVIPQVETLLGGHYTPDHLRHLFQQKPDVLDPVRLEALAKGTPPNVLVIVNEPRYDWMKPLHEIGAYLSIFEVFRSARNEYMFRVNGDHLGVDSSVLSRCYVDRLLPRFLVVESPAAIMHLQNQSIQIRFDGKSTDWKLFITQEKVWLQSNRTVPLAKGKQYDLASDAEGQLYLTQAN